MLYPIKIYCIQYHMLCILDILYSKYIYAILYTLYPIIYILDAYYIYLLYMYCKDDRDASLSSS